MWYTFYYQCSLFIFCLFMCFIQPNSADLFEFLLNSCPLQSYSCPRVFSSSLGEGWVLSHLCDFAAISALVPCFPFFAWILITLSVFPVQDKICCVWICSTTLKTKKKIYLKFLKILTEILTDGDSLQWRLMIKQNSELSKNGCREAVFHWDMTITRK